MTDRHTDIRITTESTEAAPAPTVATPVEERPFSIAVVGDFSGRRSRAAHRSASEDPGAEAVLVDRDCLDEVMARLAPEVSLDVDDGGPPRRIRFRDLDDFHPDQLFARLPLFQELRGLRARIADSATFADAAAEIRNSSAADAAPAGVTAEADPAVVTASAPPPPPDPAGFLDRIVAATASADASVAEVEAPGSDVDFRGLVHRLVAPYLEAEADPRQAELVAEVDVAITGQMRAILHHPDFQAMEALWRMLDLVVRQVETGVLLRVYLLDLTREELAADLRQASGSETPLRALLRQGPEDGSRGPWSLFAGAYAFESNEGDMELLGALAGLAAGAGAPWISAAHPSVPGASSLAALQEPGDWQPPGSAWDEFRRGTHASWIGLALPRILVRLPYGVESDPIDTFRFEEIEDSESPTLLWGNAALACALFLGRSFAAAGWAMDPRGTHELDGLPQLILRGGGDARLQPCAETSLPEGAVERLLDAGVMPFLAARDKSTVRLPRFQSVAYPLSRLAGPWE